MNQLSFDAQAILDGFWQGRDYIEAKNLINSLASAIRAAALFPDDWDADDCNNHLLSIADELSSTTEETND